MKKLPTELTNLSEVNNNTYVYSDPMEMMEDMKRLRRKFGWMASWSSTTKNFIFHMTDPASDDDPNGGLFAQFEIRVEVVYQKLWPSLYPKDPNITKLRNWFFARQGPNKIANWLNETLKDPAPLPEESSAWSRLLSDDDLV